MSIGSGYVRNFRNVYVFCFLASLYILTLFSFRTVSDTEAPIFDRMLR